MGYDRGDSFPFDFEPNGIPFGSKSKGKPSPRSYPIQFVRKWKYSSLSVGHFGGQFWATLDWKNNSDRMSYSCPRDYSVSRQPCLPNLRHPPKPLGPSQHYRIEGIKGGKIAPIISIDASLSDSICNFLFIHNLCLVCIIIIYFSAFLSTYAVRTVDAWGQLASPHSAYQDFNWSHGHVEFVYNGFQI